MPSVHVPECGTARSIQQAILSISSCVIFTPRCPFASILTSGLRDEPCEYGGIGVGTDHRPIQFT